MTEKILQAKRKHHYVWAKHLKRWSFNERDIYYTTSTRKIVSNSVRGIAMEKDFYQITELTGLQTDIIKEFLKMNPKALQLNDFLHYQRMRSLYLNNGNVDEEIEEALHAMKCNKMEDLYALHEKQVILIIEALIKKKLEILEDNKNMINFMSFFGLQYMRTKKIKDKMKDKIKALPCLTNLEKNTAEAMQNGWWILSYWYGINIGCSLFLDRHKGVHSLLINNTDIPFITSDQPIINIHECVSNVVKEPREYTDLYYPISPNIAYLYNDSTQFPSGEVYMEAKDINKLNIKMARNAHIHIFSNSSSLLEKYKDFIPVKG